MDALEETLAGLSRSIDGARALAVVGRDGLVVGQGGEPDPELARIAAEAADLVSAAERTLGEPRGGVTRELSIRGERSALVLRGLDDELFALWLLDAQADLTAVGDAAQAAAPKLLEALR